MIGTILFWVCVIWLFLCVMALSTYIFLKWLDNNSTNKEDILHCRWTRHDQRCYMKFWDEVTKKFYDEVEFFKLLRKRRKDAKTKKA